MSNTHCCIGCSECQPSTSPQVRTVTSASLPFNSFNNFAEANALTTHENELRAEGAAAFKADVAAWLRAENDIPLPGFEYADAIESGAVERWLAERGKE